MNTAIEATYNINVPQPVSLARRAPPLAGISLPPTLSRGSIQNGHINLIISSVIRLADEERLGTDVGYPYQEWCQCSLLCSLCYARLGPAPRRSSDGYRTLSSYSSPCLPGTPACSVCRGWPRHPAFTRRFLSSRGTVAAVSSSMNPGVTYGRIVCLGVGGIPEYLGGSRVGP